MTESLSDDCAMFREAMGGSGDKQILRCAQDDKIRCAQDDKLCEVKKQALRLGLSATNVPVVLSVAKDLLYQTSGNSVSRILRILRSKNHAIDLRLRNRAKNVLALDVRLGLRVDCRTLEEERSSR